MITQYRPAMWEPQLHVFWKVSKISSGFSFFFRPKMQRAGFCWQEPAQMQPGCCSPACFPLLLSACCGFWRSLGSSGRMSSTTSLTLEQKLQELAFSLLCSHLMKTRSSRLNQYCSWPLGGWPLLAHWLSGPQSHCTCRECHSARADWCGATESCSGCYHCLIAELSSSWEVMRSWAQPHRWQSMRKSHVCEAAWTVRPAALEFTPDSHSRISTYAVQHWLTRLTFSDSSKHQLSRIEWLKKEILLHSFHTCDPGDARISENKMNAHISTQISILSDNFKSSHCFSFSACLHSEFWPLSDSAGYW